MSSRPTALPRPLAVVVTMLLLLLVGALGASAAHAAEVSGVAFKDVNRDGVKQSAEEPLVGKYVYAFDTAGVPVLHAATDAAGRYVLSGLNAGTYDVTYGASEWWELWRDWAPSTTGSERPSVTVALSASATVDFGFRPIVRSTNVLAPISTYVAPDGARFDSYNDVVTARQVHAALALGSLRGAEAAHTTVRFDYGSASTCEITTVKENGVINQFRAICEISYLKWLDSGDATLFHEYGHAWSLYYANIVHQDPTLTGYLQARGVAGDPRIGSNEEWSPREMIAEDYRQLFGTANAAARTQANRDIPPASAVLGLRDFLQGPFMQAPATEPPPAPPPPPPSPSMTVHVASMTAAVAKTTKGWRATATVTVQDASGQPVDGAAVTVRWSTRSGSGETTCTTASTGRCGAVVDLLAKIDSATLSLGSVAKDGATYASDANTGAGPITVKRPR